MADFSNQSKRTHFSLVHLGFFVVLGLVLVHRFCILYHFAFKFVDGDQAIMWLGLKDYSEGNFYEPRFYGQAYSTMLEALFAMPLYWCGMQPWFALPLVTTLLTIVPFIALAFIVRRRSPLMGIMILAIQLLLPTEYHMMTSMPRGFMPGLFIAGMASLLLFANFRLRFFLVAFLSVIAYSANANAVLLSFPVMLLFFLRNRRDRQFYIQAFAGVAAGFVIHLLVNRFYVTHPFNAVHGLSLEFSFEGIKEGIPEINRFLDFNTPIFWTAGFFSLLFFVLAAAYFFRKRLVNEGLVILSIPLLILLTLGINKVWDGDDSLSLPLARMYLPVPFLLAFVVSFFEDPKPEYLRSLVLLPLFYFGYHLWSDTTVIRGKTSNWFVVILGKVDELLNDCKRLKQLAKVHNAGLVVLNKHLYLDHYTYGCPACTEDFPNTLRPSYERRTWRLLEDENKVYENVLVIDSNQDLSAKWESVENLGNSVYLVKNNRLRTMELLEVLGIGVRRYR